MKHSCIIAVLALALLGTISCTTAKSGNDITQANEKQVTVSGTVISIDNGKDGYLAWLKGSDNKDYVAAISISNLGNNAAQFKSHTSGDKITVKGPFWKDEEGKVHITVRELK